MCCPRAGSRDTGEAGDGTGETGGGGRNAPAELSLFRGEEDRRVRQYLPRHRRHGVRAG